MTTPNRWKRYADWDQRPLRLDRFAAEDAASGFSAFSSPADPKPGLEVSGGKVVSLDGVLEHDFDMIDRFIARHHIDVAMAPEAMAMDSAQLARMLVDMNVPREDLVRLAHGMTPAKLAEVVSHLNALEIAFAYSKMRARRTPGNQAHVTNAKDDPLQLAADAATARLPVVALSANAVPRDIARGMEAGFFRYLTKPIKVHEFMETLDLALKSAASQRARVSEAGIS